MKDAFDVLLSLLRIDILGQDIATPLPPEPDSAFWRQLYSAAAGNDLAHIVAHRLEILGITPGGDTAPLFEKQHLLALFRYEQLQYEYGRISQALDEAGVPFLPLKGLLIRPLYPEPYLRTSCDIDILIQEQRLDEAIGVIEHELHYKNDGRNYHDVSLHSETGVHLELHFALTENGRAAYAEKLLADIWNRAFPVKEGHFEYRMDNALFYCYHLAHMAKHIAYGGCGVRPFLDLALMRRKLPLDEGRKNALLAEGGLADFERACLSLTDAWFENAPHTPISRRLAAYIEGGGVYGSMKNKVAAQKTTGKGRYLLSRLWLPYAVLVQLYPAAKHRILVPFFQIRRLLTRVFSRSLSRGVKEVHTVRKISDADCSAAQSLMRDLGLQPPEPENPANEACDP